jgi:MFS family permease
MGYRELLRTQTTFRKLWFGQIVSECGDWLQFIALLSLFPTSSEGVTALAGLFIVRLVPWIVWAPIAGTIADKLSRRNVMIAADLGRALVVLGYLGVRGPEDTWLVYALAFAQESLSAFFEPARSAAIPQIVEPKALLAANSLSGATWSAMLALGGSLGGLLVATVGTRAAMIVDSLTFVVSAGILASISIPPVSRAPDEVAEADPTGLRAMRDGLRYLSRSRPQAFAALVKAMWGTSGGIVLLYSVYANQVFAKSGRAPAVSTGVLYAARGVGALVGPLVARRVLGESIPGLRRSIQAAFLVEAAAIAGLAFTDHLLVATLLVLVAHAGGSTIWVGSTQLLQLTVPNRFQGRVFAVELAWLTATMSLSSAFVGRALARAWFDLRGVTLAMVSAMLLCAAAWWLGMTRFGPRLEEACNVP